MSYTPHPFDGFLLIFFLGALVFGGMELYLRFYKYLPNALEAFGYLCIGAGVVGWLCRHQIAERL